MSMFTQVIVILKHWMIPNLVRFSRLFTVLLLLSLGGVSAPVQACPGTAGEIRTLLPSEWDVPHPAGLSYSRDYGHLFLLEKHNSGQAPAEETTVVVITPHEDWVNTTSLAFPVDDRVNVTFDDAGDRLLLLNNELAQLAQIEVGNDGLLDPTSLVRFDVAHLGIENAQGMDVDVEGRRLFILDSTASQVLSVDLDAEFGLISTTDLSHLGVTSLRGLAVDPVSHNLYIVSPSEQMLYELTQSGQLVNRYDLASLELVDPGGLDFGASADLTDPLNTTHLYLADSGPPDSQSIITKFYLPLLARWNFNRVATSRVIRLDRK